MLTALGKLIENRMDELGISNISDLARIAGISKSSIVRMRNEEHAINSRTVRLLAEALRCEEAEIQALVPEPKWKPRRTNLEPQFQTSRTICWKCQNAVPDKHGRGCNWSRNLEPVDGWKALETSVIRYDGGVRREIMSALVVECPEFIPDGED